MPPARGLELKVPPVAVGLIVAALMWSIARCGPRMAAGGTARGVVALLLLAAGLGVAIAGVLHFRRARTTVNPLRPEQASSMVTTGVYRWSRNPMYLGMLLVLAAWAAWLGSLLALAGLPLFVAYMARFQIVPEERALAARFPDEFARYARSVRRWA
jgi:protein-S-isoprenylcysteine O-methyltransferase Ste14